MSYRFRKSVKLAPGLRLNVGRSGMSLTAGARGASVNVGKRGVYSNVGIPGTGLSSRQGIGPSSARQGSVTSGLAAQVQISLKDDGTVTLHDRDGNALPSSVERQTRKQMNDQIRDWLEEHCEHWNQGIEEILRLHLRTPGPGTRLTFQRTPFAESEPSKPEEYGLGLLGRLSSRRRDKIQAHNAEAAKAYEEELADLQARRASHEESELKQERKFREGRLKDVEVMEDFLGEHLAALQWPRETLVSYSVEGGGTCVVVDVDLPEIEGMPRQLARVASKGLRVIVKEKSDAQVRKEYMAHIHAIAFRLVGETFVALPTAQTVVCSGYSQRLDPASGKARDEYLYSVRVDRSAWSAIAFDNLAAIDPVACLEQFGMRRKMSKTGVFEAIEPLRSC